MQNAMIITWCLCAFVVIWAMAGYPVFLQILDKFRRDPFFATIVEIRC